jgi:hypothetical protein
MSTENNQSNSIIPETPGKSPAPYYTANQYARHAALVKQTNEWLLDKYRRQLRNTHHILRDKEQLLAKKEQELVEKEIQLRLAKQELLHPAIRPRYIERLNFWVRNKLNNNDTTSGGRLDAS